MMKKIQVIEIICVYVLAVIAYLTLGFILNHGVSCDEGYYLLGYLPNAIHSGVSDFHTIVSVLFGRWYGDNPCIFLRIVRYIWTLLGSLLFAWSAYRFIKHRYQCANVALVPLILIAAAVSFCFASPILYYDSLQMLFYLMLFALWMFAYDNTKPIRLICAFLMGMLLVFMLPNHLPSGILAIVAIIVLTIALMDWREWQFWLLLLLGFGVSCMVYHYFFTPLDIWLQRVSNALLVAKTSGTRHDNGSLITNMLIHLAKVCGVTIGVGGLYGVIMGIVKHKCPTRFCWIEWGMRILLALLLMILVFKLKWKIGTFCYYAILGMLLAEIYVLRTQTSLDWHALFSVDALFLIALMLLPCAGVFGTNLPLHIRTLMFVPFLVVALVVLLRHIPGVKYYYEVLITIIMFEMFVLMCVMDRYEYYGSPHKACCVKMDTPRLNDIYVTNTQKAYFENVYHQLVANGFESRDAILSSDENFIGVYAAGGVADGLLHYDLYQMCVDPNSVNIVPPRFIIMYQRYYDKVCDFGRDIWNFPDGYISIELGKYSPNLPDNCVSTLYVRQ